MPTLDVQTLVVIVIIALFCIAGIIIFAFRQQKETEKRIRNAFGKVLTYDEEGISYLSSYYEYASLKKPNANLLDDTTWNDLNLDNVFQRINASSSSIGEEYLYYVLHDLKTNLADVKKREEIICRMEEHPDERVKLQKILLALGKRRENGLSAFLFNAQAKQLTHPWIYTVMALLPFAGIALIPFFAMASLIFIIAVLSLNVFLYSRKRIMLGGELETMQYFSALLHAAKLIQRKCGNTMKLLDLNLSAASKPFRKTGGFIPGNIQHVTNEIESLIILFEAMFLIDLILYNRTVNRLIRYTNELNQLFQIVGELDTAICIASFRRSLPWYCGLSSVLIMPSGFPKYIIPC